MKQLIKWMILASIVLASFVALTFSKKNPCPIIYISQTIEHPALNRTVKGIRDVLYQKGFEVQVESAQANPALASQIASKFMAQNPKIVVGIGTISAQSFIKYALQNKVKLIFSSVTDPKNSLPVSANIGGVSNFIPLEPQLALFKSLQPNLKRLGILYNSGEANSVSIVKKLKNICEKYNLILIEQTIAKTSDVAQSVVQLMKRCDAIFISNDNTVLSAIKTITKVSNIPVYVSDTDTVKLGAKAALGPDQYEVGKQTGKMILRVLQGNSLTTEYPKKVIKVVRS